MKTLIRLSAYIRKQWILLLIAFLCLAVSTGANLIVPRILGQGINTAVSSGLQSQVVIQAVFILVAAAVTGFGGYGQRYLSQVASQKVSYEMRNDLYNHLQQLSFGYYDKAQTGQIMSRATVDVQAVNMFLGQGFLMIIQNVLMLLGIVYLMISLDWKLALMTLVFMPPIVWLAYSFGAKIRPMWTKVQQTIAVLGIRLQESLVGIRVVKSFSRQKDESDKFKADATVLYNTMVKTMRVQAINMPLMWALLTVPTAIILWYGGNQVINGSLNIGDITEFILYLGMLAMPIQMLGGVVGMFTRSISAGERIIEILDTESPVKEKEGAIDLGRVKGGVCFENVGFRYNEKVAALDNISFKVQPGQLVALVGSSGSGKSTLAHLMSRFYDVTDGRITIDGVDIRDVTLRSLRKNVVVAQQDVFLFSASVKDNIAYGVAGATMEQITWAAKTAQIHDFIKTLPDGYKTWTGDRGLTLSGGEKQRIVIARTLLINPAILVLDDSTSSVDARTERLIRNALDELIKGRTTFIITHRLPLIQTADLILVLKDGEIVEQGKHLDLMARNGIYRQIYMAQMEVTQEAPTTLTEAN